ncbi:MAG: hypothetical protein AAB675_02825 [Patescibacteria group bacterium]
MHKILTSSSFLIPTIFIASIYILFSTYLMNSRIVLDTLIGSFSFTYKVSLMFALLGGMWTAMSGSGLILLFLSATLTGANLVLLAKQVKILKRAQNLHLVVGGNTLLGLAGSGCAVCSLPILSLLGFSGSIIYLPFRGAEISYLAVILLSISFYLLLRSVFEKEYCLLPSENKLIRKRRVA